MQKPLDPMAIGKAPKVFAAIPPHEVDQLDELARRRGVHRSALIREAIRALLAEEAPQAS
jgi:metal-responsive CopG/Arc/MetJ family transcriptional regulator